MNHIIFDLELNSPFQINPLTDAVKNKNCPNEIIEIGAVKVNEKFEITDTFQSFVKPTVYKKLSPIIKKKTRITYKDVYSSRRFNAVIKSFREWLGEDGYVLYSWGQCDLVDLRRNCRCHHIKPNWLTHFKDLQKEFGIKYETDKGMNCSLKRALEFMDIELGDQLHRALVDAEYTTRVFIKMNSDDINSINSNDISSMNSDDISSLTQQEE